MNKDEGFSEKAAKLADEIRRQDFKDLQDEYAGRENGRAKRFLDEDAQDSRNSSKKKAKRQAEQLSRLQQLLTNTAYANLYNNAMNQLRDMEDRTQQEIERITQFLIQVREDLNTILDQAATLPNGVRVFKNASGQVMTEHGEEVKGQALEEILWNGNEPSYESFIAKKQEIEQAETSLKQWQTYQVGTLGRIRDRLTDENNPSKPEDIQGFQSEINRTPNPFEKKPSEMDRNQFEQAQRPATDQIPDFK